MITLRQLLSLPENAGDFGPERVQRLEQALAEDRRSDLPWYLRALVALGAWLASAFFLGFFLLLIGDQESHRTSIGVIGVMLLIAASVLTRANLGLFVNQCCLAACLAGQLMIYYGFLPEQHHTLGSAVVFSIVLAVALYGLYPDMLQRLITCVAALQITLVWIHLGNNVDGLFEGSPLGHHVLLWANSYWVMQLVVLALCFMLVSRRSVSLAPLGYALIFSLIAWQVENLFGLWFRNEISIALTPGPSTIVKAHLPWLYYFRPVCTALMLFGIVTWAAGGRGSWSRFPLPFASLACALIAIAWFGAGGILLALLLLVLGFFIESSVIVGIGMILLPIFLFTYYYNLQLDLLAKSAALAGCGLALLLLRRGLKRWLWLEVREVS